MKVVFDSSALIPASRYAVDGKRICEHLVESVDIHIPIAVADEIVMHPEKYASEALLHKLISQRKIIVNAVHPPNDAAEILAGYKLGAGEQEAILLYWQNQQKFDRLVVDDYVATIVCRRLQIDCMLLLDLIVQLGEESIVPRELAIAMIYKIAPRYTRGFIEHSLRMLGERKVSEMPAPYELSKEALEAYISGNFSTAGMSPQEADLWQRLARGYKEYAEGNFSLSWMAAHLQMTVHEIDDLLEQMQLPVAAATDALALPSVFRGESTPVPKKYQTAPRFQPAMREKT